MSTTTEGQTSGAVERVPAEVFPPGEYLRDELEERGWTQVEFAEILGRPTRLVNEIIAGKKSITPATAREIGAALGTSPMFWLNLESAYQLYRNAEPVPKRIAREARLRERYPVREMIRRGWIEPSDSAEVLESRVLRFYGTTSVEEEPCFQAHAARKTGYVSTLNPLQEAWLFRVKQIAEAMVVPPYSESKLRAVVPALKELLSEPENVRLVPRLLGECGVRFVIVEPLPSSKIDGVCFWMAEEMDAPVIALSLRFDRIDNFWFVVRHEIEHVLRGDGRGGEPIVDSELVSVPAADSAGEALPPEEIAANTAAAEFCVPAADLVDFVLRVHVMNWEARVVEFAHRIGVHPGLVAGQLQRQANRYDFLRRHLVKIRHFVLPDAIADGYGQIFHLTP